MGSDLNLAHGEDGWPQLRQIRLHVGLGGADVTVPHRDSGQGDATPGGLINFATKTPSLGVSPIALRGGQTGDCHGLLDESVEPPLSYLGAAAGAPLQG